MKKHLLPILTLLLLALLLSAASADVYVKPAELPDDFIMGMDVSSVLALERSGVTYADADGSVRDLFDILAENGVNWIRVRVWNDPWDAEGHGFGGGNNDLEAAIAIGQRATAAGMRVLVDFHYSDFWADPNKQAAPRAWQSLSVKEKIPALYDYTFDALTRLREAGVDVGMVQLGNETNGRFCGEKIWMKIYQLMDAGARACRAVDPDIRIAVHFTNPESAEQMLTFASKLDYYKLDYDIFATSYYPYWHGTIDNLKDVLTQVRDTYGKQVMVAETSYAYTLADTDFSSNTIGEGGSYEKYYPFTVQGQTNEVADVIRAMGEIGGAGVFYWEGAWITVGTESWEQNHLLWEEFGSGWASSYAAVYDPDDAGKWYGGSACDNQAMFDEKGRALDSLAIFRLIREGNEIAIAPDAVSEVYMMLDLDSEVVLPDTVNAIMNDGSLQAIPVTWEAHNPEAISHGGVHTYVIRGEAQGMEALCTIDMVEYNYVANWTFEDSDSSMWIAADNAAADQLYIEEKKADSLTGIRHYHFYSAAAESVNFDLEQKISVPAGTYRYEISIQGGDGGDTDIYSYVKINGEIVAACPSQITKWNEWFTPVIPEFTAADGDEVIIGIHVMCKGAGAWGKIDDAKVTSVKK